MFNAILRSLVPAVIALILSANPLFAASRAATDVKEVKFRWAFGAIIGSSNSSRVESVTKDSVLKSGDKLRVLVELRKKCFVYLIHQNSQGEVAMLFPYDLKQFDTDYQPGRPYYVPKGEAWFQLDTRTGSETFSLIASDQRLLDIEYLYSKYVSSEPIKKPELADRMAAEINSLRRQYQATGEQAEVLARGESRERGFERATGADPSDISILAKDIAFDNLYTETIVIEHR